MAIRIPSAKTYSRQNPKVRDNVVERIEVGAVEVTPNNEYETPVYNEKIELDFSNLSVEYVRSEGKNQVGYRIGGSVCGNGSVIYDGYIRLSGITVKKNEKNSYVSKLLTGLDKNGNSYIRISKRIQKNIYSYYVNNALTLTGLDNNGYFDFDKIRLFSGAKTQERETENATELSRYYSKFTLGFYDSANDIVTWQKEIVENATSGEENISDYSIYTRVYAGIGGDDYKFITRENLEIDEPYKKYEAGYYEAYDYYQLYEIKVLVSRDMYSCVSFSGKDVAFGNTYGATVLEYKQTAKQLEITLYGNTIGIDLNDKTVYINGEAQKKVHSVEGNELMQTSNYLLDSGAKAIETMYGATQKEYERGKETATIRCSIGDYYDYKSGEKVISADFIGKDTFHDEYQEVEYIESTGTQYIDTGYYATQNTNYEIDMKISSIAHNYQQCLASSKSASFVPKIYNWSGVLDQLSVDLKTSRIYVYGLSTARGKIKVVGLNLYYNDTLHGTFRTTRDEGKDTLPIWLCNSASEPTLGAAMRLYGFKVWEKETLVRDFIPVYRKSDGAIGLYDLVGKSFYANAGTGTFLKGADTEVEVEPTGKALKMSFEIGDEVIPMVYGADGKDYPMSTYKNGSPKVFVVRGSKIFYDGAIFQEIFLQERLTN